MCNVHICLPGSWDSWVREVVSSFKDGNAPIEDGHVATSSTNAKATERNMGAHWQATSVPSKAALARTGLWTKCLLSPITQRISNDIVSVMPWGSSFAKKHQTRMCWAGIFSPLFAAGCLSCSHFWTGWWRVSVPTCSHSSAALSGHSCFYKNWCRALSLQNLISMKPNNKY